MLVLWSAMFVAVGIGANHELEELLDGHLAQAAALIALHGDDVRDISHGRTPREHGGDARRVMWQVWQGGTLLHRSANAPATPMSPAQAGYSIGEFSGRAWRVFDSGDQTGVARVQIAERMSDRRDILLALGLNMLWPMLLALPLLALTVVLAVRVSLEPLRRIRTLLEDRRPPALDPLPAEGIPSEIRPLVDAVNGLLARIGMAMAQERRFTADAAHELRTPIAALRAQAQVALGSTDARERRDALMATLHACDRAARLLEQLLMLARLDATEGVQDSSDVDLDAAARAVISQLAESSPARAEDLAFESCGAVRVIASPTLVGVLLRNLVDNALRYSLAGTEVHIGIESGPDRVRLTVEDGGKGLDDATLARLGERFFRVSPEGPPGTGLGWSIIRRIAELYGLHVSTDRSPSLGGLRVQVVFPAPVSH